MMYVVVWRVSICPARSQSVCTTTCMGAPCTFRFFIIFVLDTIVCIVAVVVGISNISEFLSRGWQFVGDHGIK
jgi:hypothetical protein